MQYKKLLLFLNYTPGNEDPRGLKIIIYYYYYAAFNAPCVGHNDEELQARLPIYCK